MHYRLMHTEIYDIRSENATSDEAMSRFTNDVFVATKFL